MKCSLVNLPYRLTLHDLLPQLRSHCLSSSRLTRARKEREGETLGTSLFFASVLSHSKEFRAINLKLNLNDVITVSGERNHARSIFWLERQRIHFEILRVKKAAQFTASHTTLLYFGLIPSTIFQCFHEVPIPPGTWENCVSCNFIT